MRVSWGNHVFHHGRLRIAAGLVIAAVVLTLGALAPTARAGTIIHVTTTVPGVNTADGLCSLQEAIHAANGDVSLAPGVAGECPAGDGADTIALQAFGQYTMTAPVDDAANYVGATATPIVTSSILIEGQGAKIVHGGGTAPPFRAFAVAETGNLTLRETHVEGFEVSGGDGRLGGGGGLGAGGAVYVHGGMLAVVQSTFVRNGALGGDGASLPEAGAIAGGGGGGLGGDGGRGGGEYGTHSEAGGGGGSRADGGDGGQITGGDGGGRISGRLPCGGAGGVQQQIGGSGEDGTCRGGGGGGGTEPDTAFDVAAEGGDGHYGGGGGGGGCCSGDGGHGGFGGAGGGSGITLSDDGGGGDGGNGGFGAGGGAGPDEAISLGGGPGEGGTFGGDAGNIHGGGGAGLGGAIFGHEATIVVENSTFLNNYANRGRSAGSGGTDGRGAGGAIFLAAGSLTVVHSTLSDNQTGEFTTGAGGIGGGGIVVYKPTTGQSTSFTLRNTILAGNGHDHECYVRNSPTVSGSGNLIVKSSPPSVSGQDHKACPGVAVSDDPQLGSLALNYPGRTMTMSIPSTSPSPALDAADPAHGLQTSQNLVLRPLGAGYDIGAYEALPPDTTAPTAAPTQAPAANAAGWNTGDVTVTWNWADNTGGSGIDSAQCTTSSTSSGEGADIVLGATCKDLAGNTGNASYTVDVDKTAPTVTCGTTPVYTLGGAHAADVTATVADGLSGPVASSVTADVTATDVSTPGVKSKSLTGQDVAGNSRTAPCPYVVAYNFLGFFEPIPQTSYRRGSRIPVKFMLGDAAGTPIPDADAQALLSPTCLVKIVLDTTVQPGCATYNAVTDTFQYDLKTPRNLAAGSHTVGIRVSAPDASGVLNTNSTTVVIR